MLLRRVISRSHVRRYSMPIGFTRLQTIINASKEIDRGIFNDINKLPCEYFSDDGTIKRIIDVIRENKNYSNIGINGLLYRDEYPVHDIYCKIIKEDNFFIKEVPSQYLADVLLEMNSDFFTGENLTICPPMSGELYNKFFDNVPLFKLTDNDGIRWQKFGTYVGSYNSTEWTYNTYPAPELTLVADPIKFLKQYDDWIGPHHIQQVLISDKASIIPHFHYLEINSDSENVIKPIGKKWITHGFTSKKQSSNLSEWEARN